MDKADGTLFEIFYNNNISNTQLLSWIKQNIYFLATLQTKHLLTHRDIKPDNIFIKGSLSLLGDFGSMRKILEGN